MGVTVRLGPILTQYANGRPAFDLEAGTLGQCLEQLSKESASLAKFFSRRGNAFDYVNVYVSGRPMFPKELNQALNDNSEVFIMVPYTGG